MDQSPPVWLKVCVTCDRSAPSGSPRSNHGAVLADRLEAILTGPEAAVLRRVPCLSGCKHPGNIALGASGWAKIRLSNLDLAQAPAIAALAVRFAASGDGSLNDDEYPTGLKGHLAAVILPQ
jgi:predicted metal-binding protein